MSLPKRYTFIQPEGSKAHLLYVVNWIFIDFITA